MSQTRSLKEERVNIGQIIKANPKQVKQGPVLRGPASLAVFSCGIRLTPLEAVIDGCSLPKTQRNQALVLLVISGPISKGTSLAECYYLVLSGQHIVTSIIQSLSVLPLLAITSGHCLSIPQCMPNVRLLSSIVAEISLIQFSFVVLKGPSNCSHAVGPKGEISGDELESSRQSSRLEGLQTANGSDLRGRPDP